MELMPLFLNANVKLVVHGRVQRQKRQTPLIDSIRVFDDRKPLRPKLPIPSRDCAASKIPRSGSFPDLESNESDPTPGACYESLMNNIITPLMTFSQYSYPPDTVRYKYQDHGGD